jgi:hypothetical protein
MYKNHGIGVLHHLNPSPILMEAGPGPSGDQIDRDVGPLGGNGAEGTRWLHSPHFEGAA